MKENYMASYIQLTRSSYLYQSQHPNQFKMMILLLKMISPLNLFLKLVLTNLLKAKYQKCLNLEEILRLNQVQFVQKLQLN